MTDRIAKLCAYLDKCESFADVGCDHGYCTRYMLEHGLCERAVIADISPKCLEKARILLKSYIDGGRVESVCCNGLEKIDGAIGQVLIAGMGGEEIINILKSAYIPASFVLQPMRNVRELREYLIAADAAIIRDEVFKSGGKFYYVIKGGCRGVRPNYTRARLEFGLDTGSADFQEYLAAEIAKKRAYLARGLSETSRAEIESDLHFMQGVLNGEIE